MNRPISEGGRFEKSTNRKLINLRKLGDSNPRYSHPYGSLANYWFQPLTQTSSVLPFRGDSEVALALKCGAKVSTYFRFCKFFTIFFHFSLKDGGFCKRNDLSEIGIHSFFLANSGLGTVTAIDGGIVGQLGNDGAKTVEQSLPRATLKIGAPYAHAEECVAGEYDLFLLTIEAYAAGGVSGGVEHLQLMSAESNDITLCQKTADGRSGMIVRQAEEVGSLLCQVLGQKLVVGMQFGLQAEGIVDGVVAKAVIQMAVGAEQVDRLQPFLVHIPDDGLTLCIVVGTTVNDDALTAVIAHHVGIFLQHVTAKSLDLQHKIV